MFERLQMSAYFAYFVFNSAFYITRCTFFAYNVKRHDHEFEFCFLTVFLHIYLNMMIQYHFMQVWAIFKK